MSELPTGTVTLLFSDIEGSTGLVQELGDRYASLLDTYRALVRDVVRHADGHEVDTPGDSFFVAFARAGDAVRAAVQIQRALSVADGLEGVRFPTRMGVHTGAPQRAGFGYVGVDVHHAARLMAAGHGGQVLLSDATRALAAHDLPPGVGLRDLGEHRLKDLPRPEHIFQLIIDDLPADFPPLKTRDSHPNNLPLQATPFVGREREGAAVRQLLSDPAVRLITLTGPGGAGKTRLAVEVAASLLADFPDGVWFVDLAQVHDPAHVVPAIAATLGITQTGSERLQERVAALLRDRRLLLVLDNFEHLLAASPLLAELRAAAPQIKLLVTSRTPLHLSGEYEYPVPTLAVPSAGYDGDLARLSQYDAVALFIGRARAVKPDFEVTNATAPAVAQICVRLDGLPLAIELAAARVKVLSPEAILARLERRLTLLTSGPRDLPARQQTLRGAMDWSYDLLDPDEQILFARLGVFVGGCTLEAVDAICLSEHDAPDWPAVPPLSQDALDGVTSLVDKSLVQQRLDQPGETRFTLLETIREYALERLAQRGEVDSLTRRHAQYYLSLAIAAQPKIEGLDPDPWLSRLAIEHANLQAGLSWSLQAVEMSAEPPASTSPRITIALQLAAALWPFWHRRGQVAEGRGWLERVLAQSVTSGWAGDTRARAGVLAGAGVFALIQGEAALAETRLTESLAAATALGDARTRARILCWLGQTSDACGDRERALALLEEGLALARMIHDPGNVLETLFPLGEMAYDAGDFGVATAYAQEALEVARQAGAQLPMARALIMLGQIARLRGDFQESRGRLEESLALVRGLQDRWAMAGALVHQAWLAQSESRREQAEALLDEAVAHCQAVGNSAVLADACYIRGLIMREQGDQERAEALFEESLSRYRQLGNKRGMAQALGDLAQVRKDQGDYGGATTLAEEALRLAEQMGNTYTRARALNDLGYIAYAQGDYAGAGARLEECLRLCHTAEQRVWIAGLLSTLGRIACLQGQMIRARERFHDSLVRFRDLGELGGVAYTLEGVAECSAAQRTVTGAAGAARLFGAAAAIRESTQRPLPAYDRDECERGVTAARDQLEPTAFEGAWREGQAMTVEQAIAYARDVLI